MGRFLEWHTSQNHTFSVQISGSCLWEADPSPTGSENWQTSTRRQLYVVLRDYPIQYLFKHTPDFPAPDKIPLTACLHAQYETFAHLPGFR